MISEESLVQNSSLSASQSFNRSQNSSLLSQRRQQHYLMKQQKTMETLSAITDMLSTLNEKKLFDSKQPLSTINQDALAQDLSKVD